MSPPRRDPIGKGERINKKSTVCANPSPRSSSPLLFTSLVGGGTRWPFTLPLSPPCPFCAGAWGSPCRDAGESSMTTLISPKAIGCDLVERKDTTHRNFQETLAPLKYRGFCTCRLAPTLFQCFFFFFPFCPGLKFPDRAVCGQSPAPCTEGRWRFGPCGGAVRVCSAGGWPRGMFLPRERQAGLGRQAGGSSVSLLA